LNLSITTHKQWHPEASTYWGKIKAARKVLQAPPLKKQSGSSFYQTEIRYQNGIILAYRRFQNENYIAASFECR